ncbi:intraflagellar transport protein IFT81 [Toxoplasma gondii MAS]|uniref:Intraflagellar transport protein IFT81 n=2 Tax=Toxoplasma gondii TaxID=5811 RepID=A0A086Q3H4_TOXGO|nr:intraflagellar transport protein IFT81 [Toxoplasma gondii MAS]PUA86004.1 intraflagellar transport protein IFT81 [Toxoplasma gondii TgCATBr9]
MTSAQMIKEIVEGLNKHPFSMKTSLVAFDQEKPQGLLEILGKVLAYVDPERHKVDIQNESPESFFLRVAEAVHVLGYNASFDGYVKRKFERSFLSGEKDTVHPILHWLLTNLDHHKKRAYLAKFLVNIEIPTDFLAKDSQLADAYHEYKELQEKFKIFHSSTEQAESSSGGFSECKHEIQRLEKEKFLLCEKIEKLKQKPETETHLTNFLSVARELRAAQLEETTLAFRSQQQTDYFNYLSEQLDTTRKLLQALQALSGDPERGAAAYLKVLRQEERRTAEALAACIRELQQKQERLAEAEETNEKLTVYKKQLQILIEKKKALEREVRNELAAQQCATMKRSAAENEFRNARGYCFMSKDEFATVRCFHSNLKTSGAHDTSVDTLRFSA